MSAPGPAAQTARDIIEASLVQTPGDFTIELRGTQGALSYGGAAGGLFLNTGDGWQELTVPDDGAGAFDEWVRRIHDGSRADAMCFLSSDFRAPVARSTPYTS